MYTDWDKMEVKIPEGVSIKIDGNIITTAGKLGSNVRKFNGTLLEVSAASDVVKINPKQGLKKLEKIAENASKALATELENDMNGVLHYFERNMVIVYAHFPITLEEKNGTVFIKNLFGERAPRAVKLFGNTKIEIKGQNVRIYGTSKDDVNQSAAKLMNSCRMQGKDTRVFQDGVYYAIE